MRFTRRAALASLAALPVLTACGGSPTSSTTASSDTVFAPAPNPAFDAWVSGFRNRAASRGMSAPTLDRAFARVGYLPGVVERDRSQTEFTRTLEDYLAIAASDSRIAEGQLALRANRSALEEISATYGVEPNVVTAIWGLESRYGQRKGDVPVVSALATLAFDGRRGDFFEGQLIGALRILEAGDISAEAMTGSWAGAMGHTQFIPTSYLAYAVDFDGDGRRDIWGNDPTDALASAAAYLSRFGWRTGQPWGMEVRVPAGFNRAQLGRSNTRSTASWNAAGVTTVSNSPLQDFGAAALLRDQSGGPVFAANHNFNELIRYNNATPYGIGVGHLSDRIAGRPGLVTPFPPDANGLTLEDRKTLQRKLTAAGHDAGDADGVIGARTEEAIRAFQAAQGLPVDGQPSPALLAQLP